MLWWMSCRGSEKHNLLELFERSVRGEALAQSNRALRADLVLLQTAEPQKIKKINIMSDFSKHRGRCYGGCHAVWREGKNLLEFLEPSVRSEALAQSNSALRANFVVHQTAKTQKEEKK